MALQDAVVALELLRQRYTEQHQESQEIISKLHRKLARFRSVVAMVEAERDGLRDVVLELAERVESIDHGLSSLPRPRLDLPALLEPLHRSPNAPPADGDLWTYASATIAGLRAALTHEQRAHQQTRRTAQAHISLLEARIARREADLAAAGMQFDEVALSRPSSARRAEEIAQTEAQNVRLSAEVANLAAKLDRLGRAPPLHSPDAPDLDPDRTVRPRSRQRPNSAPGPSREALQTPDVSTFADEVAALGRQVDAIQLLNATVAPERVALPLSPPALSPPTASPRADEDNVHDALEREIAGLGAQVNALRNTRALLWEQVRAAQDEDIRPESPQSRPTSPEPEPRPRFTRPPTPGPPRRRQSASSIETSESPQSPRVLPHSPPQNTLSPPSLTPDRSPTVTLGSAAAESTFRPLRASPMSANGAELRPNLSNSLLLDWDGEQSMELATPLIPSVVLPALSASSDDAGPVSALPDAMAEEPPVVDQTYTLLPTAGPSPDVEFGMLLSSPRDRSPR
ncbi:hypothetical protein MKEN_01202800 [Mycena kentingensis (nom. inval.)]|nr:hypothetical protein MKEN_01202800 [Mycena kentingensis (nom. inval.)]